MTPVDVPPPMEDLEHVPNTLPSLDGEVYAPPIWHDGGAERPTAHQLDPRRFAVALALATGAVNLALFLFTDTAQSYANSHISFCGDKTVWIPVLWLGGAGAFATYLVTLRAYWRVIAIAEIATILYWSYRMLFLACQGCADSG